MAINQPNGDQTLSIAKILKNERKGRLNKNMVTVIIFMLVLISLWQSGMFDGKRLSEGLPAIGVLISEMTPPNFTRWRDWIVPMSETITMSIAGTAISIVLALPIACLLYTSPSPRD